MKNKLLDKKGMKFYIHVTSCTDNKSNGKITLDTYGKNIFIRL